MTFFALYNVVDSTTMSLFPPRCFTCGKPIYLDPYQKLMSSGLSQDISLDKLGYRRMCCRRMFISYPEELEQSLSLYDLSKKSGDPKIEHTF
jgi:DNA-directed RNA polymerase subunit N (RpoN/RPB10)